MFELNDKSVLMDDMVIELKEELMDEGVLELKDDSELAVVIELTELAELTLDTEVRDETDERELTDETELLEVAVDKLDVSSSVLELDEELFNVSSTSANNLITSPGLSTNGPSAMICLAVDAEAEARVVRMPSRVADIAY